MPIAYDEDGNLTALGDDRGESVTRAFDDAGNLQSQTDGRGTLSYAYDELNRLTALTDTSSDVLDFAYDPEGNLTEADLPNGVTTTMAYDDANRLASSTSVDSSSNVLQSFDYAYNSAGQRTSSTDRNSDETDYAYDALGRLSSFDPPGSGSTAYAYDDAGNRTQAGGTTYSYNALNELTSDSQGTAYTYDGAGRLTQTDDGTTTTDYAYDALDQMTQVDDGSSTIDFTYDALGRRSERTDSSGTTTAHYGDLTDIATRDSDASGTTATYVQGPAGLAEQSDGTTTSFPLPDAHGDVTTLTDASGAVASRQAYDPWGEQISGPDLEMGWLGAQERRADPDTGLVQMGVRGYAPGLGVFVSEDPVLRPPIIGDRTRYGYVSGDPVNTYDLAGLCSPVPFAHFCFPDVLPDPHDVKDDVAGLVSDVACRGSEGIAQTTLPCDEDYDESPSASVERCPSFSAVANLACHSDDIADAALAAYPAVTSCVAAAAAAIEATPEIAVLGPEAAGATGLAGCAGGLLGSSSGELELPPVPRVGPRKG